MVAEGDERDDPRMGCVPVPQVELAPHTNQISMLEAILFQRTWKMLL